MFERVQREGAASIGETQILKSEVSPKTKTGPWRSGSIFLNLLAHLNTYDSQLILIAESRSNVAHCDVIPELEIR